MRLTFIGSLMLLGACADDVPQGTARDDGGVDAAKPAPSNAVRDAGVDASVDAAAARCEEERSFLASHRACTTDSDCTIAGSCSGGFGFEAIRVDARERAQAYSDRTACGAAFDGPTYRAVCEQGLCVARNSGTSCGAAQPADGGRPGCPEGEEIYLTACDGEPACRQRCSGASDDRCGASSQCEQTKVSAVSPPYGMGCGSLIDVWLCR